MSDELKRLYADEWKAAHPHPSKRDVDASERFLQALASLESQNQALQEALRDIADICHGWAGPEATASNAMRLASVAAFARNALSPTQETDRPDIEEIGRGIARDFGKTFDVLSRHNRPTQETDPE